MRKPIRNSLNIAKFIIVFAVTFLNFCALAQGNELKNAVIVGWDGTQLAHLKELLDTNQLPNLAQIINEGSFVEITASTSHTETKPGWTEVLTGYNASNLGIKSNIKYQPIPKSFTIFERFKGHFGKDAIKTIFIGGKENNIGYRGLHEICANCITRLDNREKSYYWDKKLIKTEKTRDGTPPRWVERKGEPYYYTQWSLDYHKTGLGPAENVGKEVMNSLELFGHDKFLAFFHFEDPDEMGHVYGENSKEYDEGLKKADEWLGSIISKLKELGIYEQTLLVITSDHGMDEDKKSHQKAPYTFLAINNNYKLKPSGDRKDVTPTIYTAFGIDPASFTPALDGNSLLSK